MSTRPSGRALALLWPLIIVAALSGSRSLAGVVLLLDVLVLAAYFLDARQLPRTLKLVRHTPAMARRGEPISVRYELHNAGAQRVRVRIADAWSGCDLVRDTAPGERVDERVAVTLDRRGEVTLPPPAAWLRTPLGLAEHRVRAEGAASIAVLPELRGAGAFERLRRMRNLRALGIVPVRQRGEGTEFDGLRPYAQGDAYRTIDWKATARRDRLVVRQMRAEVQQQLVLLLDCGRRTAREIDGRSRLDHSIEAALLLAQVALRSGDRVGLVAFADEVLRVVMPAQGVAQAGRIAEAVATLQPVLREPPYRAIVASLLQRFPRRSFFVLFTDAAEPEAVRGLVGPLAHLGRRHLVASVLFRDELIERFRSLPIDDAVQLYRAGASAELAVEREQAARTLQRGGVLVVESAAAKLSSAVVNRYLEAKARHLI